MALKRWTAMSFAAFLAACASGRGGDENEPIRALLSADALMFVSFDTDGDFGVDAAEVEAGIAREFARADSNRDGALQPIEFQNWASIVLGGGQMGPFRLDFDRNVDNSITREEFESEIRGRVRDYDADENGVLARSEFVRRVGQARPPSERTQPATPFPTPRQ
ncbi:MAG TPA: hypothetical protein DHW63_08965 [Hyphomonadaceae bacterium]|nr:hypothetical protein [Hyphomonadaceae bacterium]